MAILTVNALSQCLLRTVTFNVYLPTDNTNFLGEPLNKPPYKTLYLLHGIMGDQNDWLMNSQIAELAKAYHLAVVMPAGENRFYLDDRLKTSRYGEFIGREIIDMTRRMFPLSDKREDTFIAGLSMGGYGALRNGLKYADNFSAIGSFSGSVDMAWFLEAKENSEIPFMRREFYEQTFGDLSKLIDSDKNPRYLLEHLAKDACPDLYICCGSEDFLLAANRSLVKYLTDKDIAHTYEEWSGKHNWAFWRIAIERFLAWLPLEGTADGPSRDKVKED